MPRDGAGVYSKPAGSTASPNTTIESSKYNATIDDLVADANSARPITAGGTGATSKQAAVNALFDGTTIVDDDNFKVAANGDQSKRLALDLSGLTTATTRTLAVPDRDGTVGVPTVAPELGTTSGTSKSFTIPATAKQVTFTFYGVSTNGSSIVMLRLGDSGGVETTGYVGCSTQLFATTTGFSTDAYTSGFGIRIANAATAVLSGSVIFTRSHASDNVWIAHGVVADTANIGTCTIAGSKLLSGALTEVQLTTANGTDAFDAGAVDVYYS